MAQGDVFLTRKGCAEMHKEYDELKTKKRREIALAVEKARAMGDLRENAEYSAAKEAHAHNEKRIAELEAVLSRARIIESENIAPDKIFIGAKVKIRSADDNEIEEYLLVSEAEADFSQNKISVTSPLGKGLLGHKKGDVLQITVPRGIITVEVLEVSR